MIFTNFYIVYYPDRAEIVQLDCEPDKRDFPEADFAEGPLHTREDCEIRLAWMNRSLSA